MEKKLETRRFPPTPPGTSMIVDLVGDPSEYKFVHSFQHPNSTRFHEILKELGELHNKKQTDYGRDNDPFANVRASSDWGMPAWVGAMVRATDKIRRLQTFATKGSLANEGAEDSFKDLAVYSIIGLVLFEQDVKKGSK